MPGHLPVRSLTSPNSAARACTDVEGSPCTGCSNNAAPAQAPCSARLRRGAGTCLDDTPLPRHSSMESLNQMETVETEGLRRSSGGPATGAGQREEPHDAGAGRAVGRHRLEPLRGPAQRDPTSPDVLLERLSPNDKGIQRRTQEGAPRPTRSSA